MLLSAWFCNPIVLLMSLFCKQLKCNTIMWSYVYIFSSLITRGTTGSPYSQHEGCLQQMAVNNSFSSTFIWGKEQGEERELLCFNSMHKHLGIWGLFHRKKPRPISITYSETDCHKSDFMNRDTEHWCALPKVRRKAPKAWIPNDPINSLLPKPLNPSYLHNKTCLSVIIVPNCRSVQ